MASLVEVTRGALKVGLMLSVLTLVVCIPFLFVDFSKGGNGLLLDADALQEMKQAMTDVEGVLENWRGMDPCSWTGVVCGRDEAKGMIRVVGLALEGAGLAGPISPAIARLSELRFFLGAGNSLSGSLEDIRACKRLERLELPSNLLSGPIPRGLLVGMPRLRHLLLAQNSLVGGLEALFGEGQECGKLTTLVLGGNYLSGPIPVELGGCQSLEKLDLRGNSLVGSIPGAAFASLPHLQHLDLGNNRLEGAVPEALGGLGELAFLDLSFNRLTGDVPQALLIKSDFTLDLSGNSVNWGRTSSAQLDGGGFVKEIREPSTPVSARNWLNDIAESVKSYKKWSWSQPSLRRSMLGEPPFAAPAPAPGPAAPPGFDLSPEPSADETPSVTSSQEKKHMSTKTKIRRWALGLALGLVAGGLAAALLATILRLLLFLRRKPEIVQGPIIFSKQITPKMLETFDQPNAFQNAENLGYGGSGRVYKGVLQPGDIIVAVKVVAVQRVNQDDEEQDESAAGGTAKDGRAQGRKGQKPKLSAERRQIQSELQTLGAIRHRNLVGLLAYVARPDDHLLIYEFMENGSLHSALVRSAAGELVLDWPCRLRIAEGMATGIAYLHVECRPKVVHRDIKPGNILLDETFDAHIGDFGLAKVLEDGRSHASTGLAGTYGYIAPEYHQTAKFTTQSDIYSLGVSMAALFTGKEPSDSHFVTDFPSGLPTWLGELAREGNLEEAVDPRLRDGDRLTEEQGKEVVLALKLVLLCISADPTQRPNAAEVLKMIQQISTHEDGTRRRGLAELIAPEARFFTNFGSTIVPRDSSGSSGTK